MANQILIVDDEPDVLESFQMYLEFSGYDVITASDGKQGVAMYKKYNPCMVFSDVKMPHMDGYELFSNIIKIDSKLINQGKIGDISLQLATLYSRHFLDE